MPNSGEMMRIGDMIEPRVAFGDALVELGAANSEVVVFDSDVCTSTQTAKFREAYPDRFYEMGVAEQNMVSAAAGMSTLGFIPWVSTFAVFIAKRAVDQVRVSVAYPQLNVKHELGKMKLWLETNPSKRKSSTERFVVSWLNRAKPSPVGSVEYEASGHYAIVAERNSVPDVYERASEVMVHAEIAKMRKSLGMKS